MREPLRDKTRLEHILEAHKEVEWRPISNMRNFLVHEYFQVDNDTIWAVIHGDIVDLKKHILKYLAETDWEQWGWIVCLIM